MRVFDLTLPISPSLPVWPGDPPVLMTREASLARGDSYNLTRINLSAHTGTHIDAPLHYLPDGAAVDNLPVEGLVGPALVVATDAQHDLSAADLDRLPIPTGTSRLLLKTRNSQRWQGAIPPEFPPDFVALDASAARWVVARGIRLLGVDGLSVEAVAAEPGSPVHTTLLQAGVVIVEGLNLSQTPPGPYTLAALPMKLVGADGAPARVVAWAETEP